MKNSTFNDFLSVLPDAVESVANADRENIDYIDRLEGVNVGHSPLALLSWRPVPAMSAWLLVLPRCAR